MVYDCFQFFNEIDILNLRLHILSGVADRFVISEATETFSGLPKPLYYEENRALFAEFSDRIIHVVVDDTPDYRLPDGTPDTHRRDTFQKNAVTRGLAGCSDEDVIIFSDLDEIPDPERIRGILADFDRTKVYHFAQRLFYGYLNMEEVSGNLLAYGGEFPGIEGRARRWIGTRMLSYELLRREGWQLGELRYPERKEVGIRVPEGGWHFGYMGGKGETDIRKRVTDKVVSAAHQEYNSRYVLSRVSDRLQDGQDLFGRQAQFVRRQIDASYPLYLRTHQSEYAHLILPPEPPAARWLRHLRRGIIDGLHALGVVIKRLIKRLLRRGGNG